MKWTVLCVSNEAASLSLYQSILELDGDRVFVAEDFDDALKVTKGIALDCVIVDGKDNGISVTTEIARARPGVPIIFVSDHSELQLRVYSEAGLFVTKEEAVGDLSRCICEVIGRGVRTCKDDRRKLNRTSNVASRALREALVRWVLPW
jgi:DNA-binding response OmpR family regulator